MSYLLDRLHTCVSVGGGSSCAGDAQLRKRTGKNGAFWACSRYPDCRQTASTESSAGGRRRGTRKDLRAGAADVDKAGGRVTRNRRSGRHQPNTKTGPSVCLDVVRGK